MQHVQAVQKGVRKTQLVVAIPLMASLAFLLQWLEFALPIFPNFLKFDFSTLVGLTGAILFGPAAGVMIELLKNALHFLFYPGGSLFVGEVANFLAGTCLILATVFLYRRKASVWSLALGLVIGTLFMTAVMSIANVYLLLPAYAALSHISVEELLGAFGFTSVWPYILWLIVPFNLVKGAMLTVLGVPLVQRVVPVLRKTMR